VSGGGLVGARMWVVAGDARGGVSGGGLVGARVGVGDGGRGTARARHGQRPVSAAAPSLCTSAPSPHVLQHPS
jgi:hypothetical protein